VTAVGTSRTQCWLQAVSGCYLSVCIAYTSNASVYMVQAAICSAYNVITFLSAWKEYSISNFLALLSHMISVGKLTLTQ